MKKLIEPLDKLGRMLFLPLIRLAVVSTIMIDRIIIFLASHGVTFLADYANLIKPVFYFIKIYPYDLIFHVILWFGFFNDVVTNAERLNNAGKVSLKERKQSFKMGMFKASVLLAFAFNFEGIFFYEILFFSITNFILTYAAFKGIEKMAKKYGSYDHNSHMEQHLKSNKKKSTQMVKTSLD